MANRIRGRIPTLRGALGALLTATLLVSLALPAQAGNWKGKETVEDGVVHVHNPAEGIDPPMTIDLEESYRLGGWSEDQFFGIITDFDQDADGNIYLLDAQLKEIQIYDKTGAHVNTIGREGEAPGEFNNGGNMFWMPDGRLAVLQTFPGRIVTLHPDGTPGEDLKLEELPGGGFRVLLGGGLAGDKLALVYGVNSPTETSFTRSTELAFYDMAGKQTSHVYEVDSTMDFSAPKITELEWDTFQNRWASDPQGRVYLVPDVREYRINVYSPEGKLERVITRDHDPYARTDEQTERMKEIYKGFTRQVPFPNITYEVEKNHPPIQGGGLLVRDDGSLWVRTSRGTVETPDDQLGTFDVYDPKGRFVRQVTLKGQCNWENDGIFFAGDQVVVVTQFLTSLMSLQGGGGEETEEMEEDAEPMSVICYRSDKLDEAAGIPKAAHSDSR